MIRRAVASDVDALLERRRGEQSFLLVLDGVEDPHNLGALLRSADGAGVDGVIIPERRAAGLTGRSRNPPSRFRSSRCRFHNDLRSKISNPQFPEPTPHV